jgi:hypothetical protein
MIPSPLTFPFPFLHPPLAFRHFLFLLLELSRAQLLGIFPLFSSSFLVFRIFRLLPHITHLQLHSQGDLLSYLDLDSPFGPFFLIRSLIHPFLLRLPDHPRRLRGLRGLRGQDAWGLFVQLAVHIPPRVLGLA